jgi:hypothetical protein
MFKSIQLLSFGAVLSILSASVVSAQMANIEGVTDFPMKGYKNWTAPK